MQTIKYYVSTLYKYQELEHRPKLIQYVFVLDDKR